jgi:hypothetical protein
VNRSFALAVLLLAGCRGTLSPLSNKLKIGQEAYVILVADGEDDLGDLFASSTGGGPRFQLTFTRVEERLPALAADGISLAFVRSRAPGDTTSEHVAVMNLLNGAERQVALPAGARVDAIAWSADGAQLFVRAGGQVLASAAPPAPTAFAPLTSAGTEPEDGPFRIVLGTPPAGFMTSCPGGSGLCVRLQDGSTVPLAAEGRGALRWSGDSVAYLEGDGYVVRPLTGGRTRALSWEPALGHPREATMYPGSGVRDGPS